MTTFDYNVFQFGYNSALYKVYFILLVPLFHAGMGLNYSLGFLILEDNNRYYNIDRKQSRSRVCKIYIIKQIKNP